VARHLLAVIGLPSTYGLRPLRAMGDAPVPLVTSMRWPEAIVPMTAMSPIPYGSVGAVSAKRCRATQVWHQGTKVWRIATSPGRRARRLTNDFVPIRPAFSGCDPASSHGQTKTGPETANAYLENGCYRSSDNETYFVPNIRLPDVFLALRTNPTSGFGQAVLQPDDGVPINAN
jgi:hypothetical protein